MQHEHGRDSVPGSKLRTHSRGRRRARTGVRVAVSTPPRQREGTNPYHPDRETLASEIVEEYVTHYHDYDRTAGRSADLSAIDLDEIEGVANAVTDLVKKLKELKTEGHNRLLLAHWYAQTYQFDQYVDLKDLCEHIETFLPDLRLECHMVKEAVDQCVLKSGCSGFAYQHSHGLSIYFPWVYVSPDYCHLEFAKKTLWHEFLDIHLKETQRKPREGFVAADGSVPLTIAEVEETRNKRKQTLLALKESCQHPHAAQGSIDRLGADGYIDKAVSNQFKKFLHRRRRSQAAGDDPGINEKIDRVIEAVARAEMPDADIPREIARRLLRGGSFGAHNSRLTDNTRLSDNTRLTDNTKLSDNTRSPSDRERAVKNLAPVIGMAFEP